MSDRYESGFMEAPKDDGPELNEEVERLLVDVMRMYGNEFEIGGNTMWDTNDGSGNSYELQEFPNRDGTVITYKITRKDIVGTRIDIKPIRWSLDRKLHVPEQPRVKGGDHSATALRAAAQQIMQDNYEALLTADIAIQPYQRPHDGKVVDIHEEFESLVAYTVDHLSYEHLVDNYRSVAALKKAHNKKRREHRKKWRISEGKLFNKFADDSEDTASD